MGFNLSIGIFPERITKKVYKLGNPLLHTFLVQGAEYALIEAGISFSAAQVVQQLRQMGIPQDKLRYLFVMHAHFDHATGIPTLKQAFPNLQVLASPYAAELLGKPRVVEGFLREEIPMVENLRKSGYQLPGNIPVIGLEAYGEQAINVDRVVEDGECIDLGEGCTLRLIAAPGHSPCSQAAYLEEEGVLFPSDCAGYPVKPGYMWPVYFYSYEQYLDSLQKLQQLPVEIVAGPHELIVSGRENCRQHLLQAVQMISTFKDAIIADFQRGLTREQISATLFDSHYINGLSQLGEQTIRGCMELLVHRSLETL